MNFPWVEIPPGTLLTGTFTVPSFSPSALPLAKEVAFTITYVPNPGAPPGTGQPAFRLAFSDDGTTPIYDTDAIGAATASGVYAVQTIGIGEIIGIKPDVTGFPETYDILVHNPGGHRYMRLEPVEVGSLGFPGTIGIVLRGVS